MGCGASKPADVVSPAATEDSRQARNSPARSDPARARSSSPSKGSGTAPPPAPQQPQKKPQLELQEYRQQYQNHRGGAVKSAAAATSDGRQNTKQNGTHDDPQRQNTASASAASSIEAGVNDPQWRQLWAANKDLLLDPMDVHAQLQDLMSNFSNKLSATEVLFLQRKVRSVVRHSQLTAESSKSRKMRKQSLSNGNGASVFQDYQDTKTVVKNYHLLTPHVLRRVLPQPPVTTGLRNSLVRGSSNDSQKSLGSLASNHEKNGDNASGSTPAIRIIETTYLLALFCHDSLWDRVAEIAKQSAEANGLEMDVNKLIEQQKDPKNGQQTIPEPSKPTASKIAQTPNGVGLHTLTFLLGLALSKCSETSDCNGTHFSMGQD